MIQKCQAAWDDQGQYDILGLYCNTGPAFFLLQFLQAFKPTTYYCRFTSLCLHPLYSQEWTWKRTLPISTTVCSNFWRTLKNRRRLISYSYFGTSAYHSLFTNMRLPISNRLIFPGHSFSKTLEKCPCTAKKNREKGCRLLQISNSAMQCSFWYFICSNKLIACYVNIYNPNLISLLLLAFGIC